jgi:N-acetylglutamate synthase-like GNAT family acetyltransferase
MNSVMKPSIRPAKPKDVSAIQRIAQLAYQSYIPRIGKPPAPMSNNYHVAVRSGNVWVLDLDGELVGIVVLVPKPDCMLLDNVAVLPERQRSGLGRMLLAFAEAKAREEGFREVQLYTNELMSENLGWYARRGYQEVSRRSDSGFNRVFMRKAL